MPIQLRPRMHHPIPNRLDLRHSYPTHRLHHQANSLNRIFRLNARPPATQIPPIRIAKLETRSSPTNPRHLTLKQRPRLPLRRFEQRKLDRRRAAIDHEYLHATPKYKPTNVTF